MTYTCAGGSPASLEGVTFPGGRFVAITDEAGTTTLTPMLYASARWLTLDPLANKYYGISPYAFCANNPINLVDNNGKLPDLLWDVASIALGVHSFIRNIEAGNTKGAIGDGLGIVVDVVAAAIPFIPGGVGTIRNGVKVASAIDVGKSIETTFDVSKNISSSTCLDDFIIISPEHQIDRSLLKKPEKRGNAFLFKEDGTPVEIHHVGQNINGPYIEMHQKDHRGKENYKKYHTLPSKNSQIDRKEFAKKRREYWQKEYDKY